MTPQIGPGESNHNPGAITLGLFQDMGWVLCSSATVDCAELGLNVGDACDDGDASTENDMVTDLTHITTVPFEAHMGYNAAADLLYLVSKTGSFYWVYNLGLDALVADIAFSENLNDITAAEYNPADGQLYVGQAGPDKILSVDPLTGVVSIHGEAPVHGGDLAIAESGSLYLATQSGDALYDVSDGSSPVYIGGIPSKVTGSARSNTSDGLMLSNFNSYVFTEINVTDASVITSYKALLDGEPFKLMYGDMAAGCLNGFDVATLMPGNTGQGSANAVETVSSNGHTSMGSADKVGATITSMPNPTTGLSKVVFVPAEAGRMLVEVYDMNGRKVATLFNQEADKDEKYSLDFDGSSLPNGVYIYRLTTPSETIIEKFMIAR